MSKIVSIHQPQYLPWIPYFAKIFKSDEFIILDDVQFQKNGVQNRNQIKTQSGKVWLTVPVQHRFGTKIRDMNIANNKILIKHLRTLEHNYKNAKYFDEVHPVLFSILSKTYDNLCKLNSDILCTILNYLGYRGIVSYSSQIDVGVALGSRLIRNLCQAQSASTYISGEGGKNYMDLEDFSSNNIEVLFIQTKVLPYQQLWRNLGFMPDLSIIDLLYNLGKGSSQYLCGLNTSY